ncbi:M57 family metalloprotease [Aquimarina aquimarini]|uniref:M57 family metalloprotease n=1 Tax=Aquimarina aquimarini TaxID=1191734 RepID=UPI000D560F08|nr:M57 family metalloprotease [Aquimarina aquimarini]
MKNLNLFAILLVALLMVQCQDEGIEEFQQAKDPIPEEIINGLNAMGFNTVDYEVLQKKEGYLVEGDIIIPTKTILNATTTSAKHRRAANILSCDAARRVTVKNNIPSINNLVRDAVNSWNEVVNSSLRVRLVRTGNADININREIGNAGSGRFPTADGRPGPVIEIDPALYDVLPANQRTQVLRFVLRHEIGHNIGFGHTNQNDPGSSHIEGTPMNDSRSTMNAQAHAVLNGNIDVSLFQSGTLSQQDIIAVRQLYPANRVCQ